jgi:hypothetical protein
VTTKAGTSAFALARVFGSFSDAGPRKTNRRYQVTPQPKVVAGGIAGAATIILVWVAGMLGVDVPAEVASAFTVLVSFAASFLKA